MSSAHCQSRHSLFVIFHWLLLSTCSLSLFFYFPVPSRCLFSFSFHLLCCLCLALCSPLLSLSCLFCWCKLPWGAWVGLCFKHSFEQQCHSQDSASDTEMDASCGVSPCIFKAQSVEQTWYLQERTLLRRESQESQKLLPTASEALMITSHSCGIPQHTLCEKIPTEMCIQKKQFECYTWILCIFRKFFSTFRYQTWTESNFGIFSLFVFVFFYSLTCHFSQYQHYFTQTRPRAW